LVIKKFPPGNLALFGPFQPLSGVKKWEEAAQKNLTQNGIRTMAFW
jgi:hypothetical protein